MFEPYPLYTRVFFWALLAVLGLVTWGLLVVARGYVLTTVLRWCTSALQGLTYGWLTLTQGKVGGGLGTAHWATGWEIRQSGLLEPGPLPLAAWRKQTLCEPRNKHALVLGPSGSGKSRGVVEPALKQWRGNAIISDLRQELWEHTHVERAALGRVWKFAPTEAGDASCNLDVLTAVRWDAPQAARDVHRIVHHLLQPGKQQRSEGFEKSAIPLLTAVICHCHQRGGSYAQGFPGVVEWALNPAQSLLEKLDEMCASPDLAIAQAARLALDESPNRRSVVWNLCLEPLAIFKDPTIASHTRASDLEWRSLLDSLEPQTLFLSVPFEDIAPLGPFVGCMVEMLLALIGSPTHRPRHQTLFMLDECANLNYLDSLERAVSYVRDTQIMCIFQNYAQFINTYGERSPLWAALGTVVAYRTLPGDDLTAEWLSRRLGVRTVWAQAFGAMDASGTSSATGLGLSTSSLGLQASWGESQSQTGMVSQSQTTRPLMHADELSKLADHDAIVLTPGCAPVMAEKFPWDGAPPPRAPRRWVRRAALASAALALGALLCWPIIERARLIHRTATLRQTTPVQPWEREALDPYKVLKDAFTRHGYDGEKAMDKWTTPQHKQAALERERDRQRFPQSETDKLLGRRAKASLDAEAWRDIWALFPEKAPPYRGTWTVRELAAAPPTHLLGTVANSVAVPVPSLRSLPGHDRQARPWRPVSQHPTLAACMAALTQHTAPLREAAERQTTPPSEWRAQVTWFDTGVVWFLWRSGQLEAERERHEFACHDRPHDLPMQPPGTSPLAYVGAWVLQEEDASQFAQGPADAKGLFLSQAACEAALKARYPQGRRWRTRDALVHTGLVWSPYGFEASGAAPPGGHTPGQAEPWRHGGHERQRVRLLTLDLPAERPGYPRAAWCQPPALPSSPLGTAGALSTLPDAMFYLEAAKRKVSDTRRLVLSGPGCGDCE